MKRVEFLEELTGTQRREIFSSVTNMEQNLFKKHERIVKAIYQIARHLDIPETMLLI